MLYIFFVHIYIFIVMYFEYWVVHFGWRGGGWWDIDGLFQFQWECLDWEGGAWNEWLVIRRVFFWREPSLWRRYRDIFLRWVCWHWDGRWEWGIWWWDTWRGTTRGSTLPESTRLCYKHSRKVPASSLAIRICSPPLSPSPLPAQITSGGSIPILSKLSSALLIYI